MVLCDGLITVDESAKHSHGQNTNGTGADGWDGTYGKQVALPVNNAGTEEGYANLIYKDGLWCTGTYRVKTDTAGSDAPHNNVQPSRAAYIWVRVS